MRMAPLVAIGCGGTGGHLFPGLAVGECLLEAGCEVLLLVSNKEVDRQATRSVRGMQVAALPAVALSGLKLLPFLQGFFRSYHESRRLFTQRRPDAVLAMGGFTSAPPVLAGKRLGAGAFLHEANSIPGRANRWLAPFVREAFVYFPAAAVLLPQPAVQVTGMPVRPQFQDLDPAACRISLGLDPARPVLVVTGGSQGARGINELVTRALPELQRLHPTLQYLHLTGQQDYDSVRAAYAGAQVKALVRPFLSEMEFALGSATVVISRAGASSLAELAAVGIPSLLIPYPHASDNHQHHNAEHFRQSGAAVAAAERDLSVDSLLALLQPLLAEERVREVMRKALTAWHTPNAAGRVADRILGTLPQDILSKAMGMGPQEALGAAAVSRGGRRYRP
jgi:UDP-N-acetylglucosamine--N-acetylmuramyl-(pentapeptide) pyrophosphoryl-undecaprenol N-acetylglucosamine transferase